VRQVWRQRAAEFQSFAITAAELPCLLTTLFDLRVDEALVQEILRAGPHTANVFHRDDGCQIVGAVLYGKPSVDLPAATTSKSMRAALRPSARSHRAIGQLDLFGSVGI
jgi:hypothetical protein